MLIVQSLTALLNRRRLQASRYPGELGCVHAAVCIMRIFRGVANSAMHVEDKMSLEQFEQLKDRFYKGSSDEDGFLTKQEFKSAINELLGVRDQDHVLSLLFVKVHHPCTHYIAN